MFQGEPNPGDLKQGDKDAEAEIEILSGRIAERLRKMDTAFAEICVQCSLLFHDPARQRAVKNGDCKTQKQSEDFQLHVAGI
jgi:hypothetical protein